MARKEASWSRDTNRTVATCAAPPERTGLSTGWSKKVDDRVTSTIFERDSGKSVHGDDEFQAVVAEVLHLHRVALPVFADADKVAAGLIGGECRAAVIAQARAENAPGVVAEGIAVAVVVAGHRLRTGGVVVE